MAVLNLKYKFKVHAISKFEDMLVLIDLITITADEEGRKNLS